MADGTRGDPLDLVLLDEWHISVLVHGSIATLEAERLRSRVELELQAWAARFGDAQDVRRVRVRVEQ